MVAIRFVRLGAGHYRVESGEGHHLADTKRSRTWTNSMGRRMHSGRWHIRTPSGAGIGWGEDTLAAAKSRTLTHYHVTLAPKKA